MISHLLRLAWNRRRTNLLITVEIFLSFLVLSAILTLGAFYLDNYRQPLGFDFRNVWAVRMQMNAEVYGRSDAGGGSPDGPSPEEQLAARRAGIAGLLDLVRDMPDVVAAAAAFNAPYLSGSSQSEVTVRGRPVEFEYNDATDSFAETMGLAITRGRWFDRTDDARDNARTVVVNERLARELFGLEDPVGKYVDEDPPGDPAASPRPRLYVVGVMRDFRKAGELEPTRNSLFVRSRLDPGATSPRLPRMLLVRVRPGTTMAFEERLMAKLQAARPTWTFQPQPLAKARSTVLRSYAPALASYALVACFLLLMVGLGLTGVLWLTVTQRSKEIGLRRAKGATVRNIQRQLVGEVVVLTTCAVAVGTALIVQFPLLDLLGFVNPGVYAAGLLLSLAGIYALTIACAYVPSRLAGSVQPAEALRYE